MLFYPIKKLKLLNKQLRKIVFSKNKSDIDQLILIIDCDYWHLTFDNNPLSGFIFPNHLFRRILLFHETLGILKFAHFSIGETAIVKPWTWSFLEFLELRWRSFIISLKLLNIIYFSFKTIKKEVPENSFQCRTFAYPLLCNIPRTIVKVEYVWLAQSWKKKSSLDLPRGVFRTLSNMRAFCVKS